MNDSVATIELNCIYNAVVMLRTQPDEGAQILLLASHPSLLLPIQTNNQYGSVFEK